MKNYNRNANFDGINFHKSNESKGCNICYYCYFIDKVFRFAMVVRICLCR